MQITDEQAENCRVLYAMMAGIPGERINLDTFRMNRESDARLLSPACGSVACIGGWASAHPYFRAQGLRFSMTNGVPDVGIRGGDFISAGHILFGKQGMLGASRHEGDQKEEALQRIRRHLLDAGRITPERNRELVEYERMLA